MKYSFIILLIFVALFGGCIEQPGIVNSTPLVNSNIEYTVVSVARIESNTIFTHTNKLQVGYLIGEKIHFVNLDLDSNIIFSNRTYLTRQHYDYTLYWNGLELK